MRRFIKSKRHGIENDEDKRSKVNKNVSVRIFKHKVLCVGRCVAPRPNDCKALSSSPATTGPKRRKEAGKDTKMNIITFYLVSILVVRRF